MRKTLVYFTVSVLLFLASCTTPEKVLKSGSIEYKIAMAQKWYGKKNYISAIPVLEELIGLLKGDGRQEDMYYLYCWASYKQGDYLISAYHFKNFTQLYPASNKNEECLYMSAVSNAKQSPKFELDQTNTYKAIEAYQQFVNEYPESKRVDTVNDQMQFLRKKLEKKALAAADLYYKTQNYKAAATAYTNLLVDFPDIEDNERIQYMVVKSHYKFAQNSVPSKKMERFKNVITDYQNFTYKFSNSKYIKEVEEYKKDAHYMAVESAFKWAKIAPIYDREYQLRVTLQEMERQLPLISDPKKIEKVAKIKENAHFLKVKYDFEYAETLNPKEQAKIYDRIIKNYYTFVDLFKDSRYFKQAELYFKKANSKTQKTN